MNTETRREYARFRQAGYQTQDALRSAKILVEWNEAESAGLVRLECEPDREPYDCGDMDEAYTNQFGKRVSAKQARKAIDEMLKRDGVWNLTSEYFDGHGWQHADSICGCAGYKRVASPFENWHVPDLMRSALDHVEQPGEH